MDYIPCPHCQGAIPLEGPRKGRCDRCGTAVEILTPTPPVPPPPPLGVRMRETVQIKDKAG